MYLTELGFLMSDYCDTVLHLYGYYSDIASYLKEENLSLEQYLGKRIRRNYRELLDVYQSIGSVLI